MSTFAHSKLGSGCTRLRSHLIVGNSDSGFDECHQHSHTGNLVFGHGPIYLRREKVLNYGVSRDTHVQMSINYLDTII